MSALEIANRYYDAFRKHSDFSEVPMAEDLQFQGPTGSIDGAQAFRGTLTGLAQGVKSLAIRHQVEAEGVVVSVYDFDMGLPGGPIPMSEVLEVRDGAIAQVELVFDSARLGGGQ